LRGTYGRFDSKTNRMADSIRDSIRTKKKDSQVFTDNIFLRTRGKLVDAVTLSGALHGSEMRE